ncbi:hypothetical protein [Flagellimonas sp.]|uniref:hypothetical protein n=1 Tax=Flagellimonas sp. TaxID=2058762 RepID=UPI003AB4CB80
MEVIENRSAWAGIDAGNEWIFRENNFERMLQLIRDHEPADYANPDSEFAQEANRVFDQRVFYFRKDGSSSGVFRRGDPWRRLNLVVVENQHLHLTQIGNTYLDDPNSRSTILTPSLLSLSSERDSPFSVLMAALLESPGHSLLLDDLAHKIVPHYIPGQTPVEDVLSANRHSFSDRTKRNITSYLKILEISEIGRINDDRFILNNESAARDFISISGDILLDRTASESAQTYDAENFNYSEDRLKPSRFSWNTGAIDPRKRLENLERATREHEKTLLKLANNTSHRGAKNFEDKQSFDLFSIKDRDSWLFEVKTVTENNISTQLRSAVGQLLEYKHRLINGDLKNPGVSEETKLAIVINADPESFIPEWWQALLDSTNITLYWVAPDSTLTPWKNGQIPFDRE